MSRRTSLVAALCVAAILAAAGIAYAVIPDSNGVYNACMLKSAGTIRLIDKSLSATSLLSHCTSLETEVSWNRQGPPGANGVSPTVAQLAAGDANCPAGGASISDAAGHVAYVCNGTNGTDGDDFAGTFTSPNGQYSLTVADTGITLEGQGARITLAGTKAEVRGDVEVSLRGGVFASIQGGAQIQLNGCNSGVVRGSDIIFGHTPVVFGPEGGSGDFPLVGGHALTSSPTVCAG